MNNIKINNLQPIKLELSELSHVELKAILGGCLIVGDSKEISCCEAEYKADGKGRGTLVSLCGMPIPKGPFTPLPIIW